MPAEKGPHGYPQDHCGITLAHKHTDPLRSSFKALQAIILVMFKYMLLPGLLAMFDC